MPNHFFRNQSRNVVNAKVIGEYVWQLERQRCKEYAVELQDHTGQKHCFANKQTMHRIVRKIKRKRKMCDLGIWLYDMSTICIENGFRQLIRAYTKCDEKCLQNVEERWNRAIKDLTKKHKEFSRLAENIWDFCNVYGNNIECRAIVAIIKCVIIGNNVQNADIA